MTQGGGRFWGTLEQNVPEVGVVGWFLTVNPPSYLLGPHPTSTPFQSSELLSSGISEDQVTALVFQKASYGVVVVGNQGQAWPPLVPSRPQIAEPYRL